jgi:hypothetical protein
MTIVARIVVLVILWAIFVVVMVVLPRRNARRAIPTVIRIFRERNAVGRDNAKAIDELGVKPPKKGVIRMIFAPRYYTIDAIGSLIKANIVQKTEDGKLYLSEENLAASKWKGCHFSYRLGLDSHYPRSGYHFCRCLFHYKAGCLTQDELQHKPRARINKRR